MATATPALEVYEAGELTVLGFGGREIVDHLSLSDCRDEIQALIREHQCRYLAFDLTGVKLIPSGMLGLLASISHAGVEVHLYNCSEDIKEVLEITKLNRRMTLHEVDVKY